MPSYRHLFAAADPSGEALVAYLSSLGAATATERAQIIDRARLPDTATLAAGDTERGRKLFALYCTSCHGANGRGDGELAQALGERAGLDLRLDAFAMVSWDGDDDDLGPGLARVIRYGLPGSPMPGHETMEDRDLADLVAWVSTLPESVEDTEVGSWEATR
jgi:cytochrome c oxidase cbb3-type subunit 2